MEKNVKNIFDVLPDYKIRIGVCGSATGTMTQDSNLIRLAEEVGATIAENQCILVNGACRGLPDESAKQAKKKGGKTIGVSPAISIIEHLEEYRSPIDHYDRFFFTGLGVLMKNVLHIRSTDGVIFLPGGIGTLNEFTIAFEEGKPIGVLTGHGGVTDHFAEIVKHAKRSLNDLIIFSDDPKTLVKNMIGMIKSREVEEGVDTYLREQDN